MNKDIKDYKINEFIDIFITQFIKKFGVVPTVTYAGYKPLSRLTLSELKECCELVLERVKKPQDNFLEGLKTKSRKIELVNVRHCYYKLGRDMGYTQTTLGLFLGFDHVSVLHGNRKVKDLISIGDTDIMLILDLIKDEITKILENDRNI